MHRVQRLVAIVAILAALVTATVGLPGNAAAQIDDLCPTPTDPPVLDGDDGDEDGDGGDGGVADLTADTEDFTAPDVADDGIDDVPPPDDTLDLTAPDLTDDSNDDLVDALDNTGDLTAPDLTDDLPDDSLDITAPGGSTEGESLAFAAFQIEECNPCDFTVTPVATSTPTEVPPTATATDPIPQFADFTQSDAFAQIVDCDEYEDGGSDDGDSDDGDGDSDGVVTELPKTGNGTNDTGAHGVSVFAGILLATVFLGAAIIDRRRRSA